MKDPNALTDPARYCSWRNNPRDMTDEEKYLLGDIHLTNAEFDKFEEERKEFERTHVWVADECDCCGHWERIPE